jgi:hypothetical protein
MGDACHILEPATRGHSTHYPEPSMSINLFGALDAIAIATPVAKGSFVFSSGDAAAAVYVICNSFRENCSDMGGLARSLRSGQNPRTASSLQRGIQRDCAGSGGFGVGIHPCKQSDGYARTQSHAYARGTEAVGAGSGENAGYDRQRARRQQIAFGREIECLARRLSLRL